MQTSHPKAHRLCLIAVAVAFVSTLSEPSAASGTLMISASSHMGVSSTFNGMTVGAPASSGNSGSASSSGAPSSPWAPTSGPSVPNAPLNLSGSSEGSGSEGGGSSGGGGLVWGDPLSADVATFGKVHTNLRYFGQTGYNGTQQAVGINFTLRY
jgi:hypothetical protein